jgi:integrase
MAGNSQKGKKHPEKALTAAAIRNAKPGRYADGNGLYLVVDDSGAKRWVLRTVIQRKRCDMGLGGLSLVTLAEAREEAVRLRKIARNGGDPLAERRKERNAALTFEQAAIRVHESFVPTFRNAKHAAQWITSLRTYVFPVFGSRQVNSIGSAEVLAALTPIWTGKPETARRVRQRMRAVFDWAKASGHRSGDNPVDGVSKALPKHNAKKGHHAALPYAKVPEFILSLRDCKAGVAARLAFEFLILTTARTSEVLLAEWKEIDLETRTWTVPPERMKAKEEHRVPLSPRCIEILKAAEEIRDGSDYVFPGRPGRPLSNMVFEMTLRDRMDRDDITPHGFRSSFRDWAEERGTFKNAVVEAALAHTVRNKVEAAYLRTKLFDQRRPLMEAWAAYATTVPKRKVVPIGREA